MNLLSIATATREPLSPIARMMLTAIYRMLSTGEQFNPALYEKSQCKPGLVASSEEHAVTITAFRLFSRQIT